MVAHLCQISCSFGHLVTAGCHGNSQPNNKLCQSFSRLVIFSPWPGLVAGHDLVMVGLCVSNCHHGHCHHGHGGAWITIVTRSVGYGRGFYFFPRYQERMFQCDKTDNNKGGKVVKVTICCPRCVLSVICQLVQ